MSSKLENLLSSYLTTIVLLILYAIGLATATLIEKHFGTVAAKTLIYYSPIFFMLQFLLVINYILVVLENQLIKKKKWGNLILHGSLIVILIGALVSHLFAEEGILHLREGEKSNQIAINTGENSHFKEIPFEVELVKFTLTRYPGSSSPSSYESDLLVHVDGKTLQKRVYMNNVLDMKGYRFFQASYDKDEQGTVLSVNKDVAGRNVTYTGYFLLLVGFLYCMVDKRSRFRYLVLRLKKINAAPKLLLLLMFLSVSFFTLHAQPQAGSMEDAVMKYPVDKEHAKRFGATPLQSNNGRMLPVNTFSSEILRKLYKETTIKGLNPDQFIISLLALPEMWMRVPLISYENQLLEKTFALSETPCTYMDLFDSGGEYKLQDALETAYNKPLAARTAFDKELMKLDEKVNILHQLFNHQLLNLFPKEDEPNHTWYAPGDDLSGFSGKDSMFVSQVFPWYISEVRDALKGGDWQEADRVLDMIHVYQQSKNTQLDISPKRIQAELTYNRLDVFRLCKIGYLITGGCLLLLSFFALFRPIKGSEYLKVILIVVVVGLFGYHTYGMGLRWYISGHAPWSNSYETMVYVAWATVLAGLIFIRKSRLTFALSTLFGGIVLFVSGLNWMDPEINPLVPVLKSPWLMFHVAVIVAAYGFMGMSCLLGICNQFLMMVSGKAAKSKLSLRIEELTVINEMSLWIGLMLLTIGTFLGAIWANESWGRYWGWDPKETWALITIVVYTVVLHVRLVKKWDNPWLLNVLSTVSFASVLMTFFGVNYLLSGMHSYGQNDYVNSLFIYLYIAAALVVLLAVVSRIKYKKNKSIFINQTINQHENI